MNSAGIVAGIHGCRAIHWDCSSWLKHPFYKNPTQKFLYTSLDEFKKAIIDASNGDQTIGDFSAWRQKLNHFDDFKASERVGGFIQSFMDDVIKTDEAKQSLDFAVEKYIKVNNVGVDFFEDSSNMWDDE